MTDCFYMFKSMSDNSVFISELRKKGSHLENTSNSYVISEYCENPFKIPLPRRQVNKELKENKNEIKGNKRNDHTDIHIDTEVEQKDKRKVTINPFMTEVELIRKLGYTNALTTLSERLSDISLLQNIEEIDNKKNRAIIKEVGSNIPVCLRTYFFYMFREVIVHTINTPAFKDFDRMLNNVQKDLHVLMFENMIKDMWKTLQNEDAMCTCKNCLGFDIYDKVKAMKNTVDIVPEDKCPYKSTNYRPNTVNNDIIETESLYDDYSPLDKDSNKEQEEQEIEEYEKRMMIEEEINLKRETHILLQRGLEEKQERLKNKFKEERRKEQEIEKKFQKERIEQIELKHVEQENYKVELVQEEYDPFREYMKQIDKTWYLTGNDMKNIGISKLTKIGIHFEADIKTAPVTDTNNRFYIFGNDNKEEMIVLLLEKLKKRARYDFSAFYLSGDGNEKYTWTGYISMDPTSKLLFVTFIKFFNGNGETIGEMFKYPGKVTATIPFK